MDPKTAEAFHNAYFGYGVTKAEARLLAVEIYETQAITLARLQADLKHARRDANEQRALVETLTKLLEEEWKS